MQLWWETQKNAIIYEIPANLDVITLHWTNDKRCRLLKWTTDTVVDGRTFDVNSYGFWWLLLSGKICSSYHLLIAYYDLFIFFLPCLLACCCQHQSSFISFNLFWLVRWIGKRKTGNFPFAFLFRFAIHCQFCCFAFFES